MWVLVLGTVGLFFPGIFCLIEGLTAERRRQAGALDDPPPSKFQEAEERRRQKNEDYRRRWLQENDYCSWLREAEDIAQQGGKRRS
jgi:hypothetical protein